MAKPKRVYTKKEKSKIEELGGLAFTQEQIADYLGITRQSFINHMKEDEDLTLHYKRGKAKTNRAITKTIVDAGTKEGAEPTKTQLTAAIFYAKTQMGWRETQVIEHQGTVGIVVDSEALRKSYEGQNPSDDT